MRRLAWLASLLMLPAGCGEGSVEAPLATYTGTVVDDAEPVPEAFFVKGTLELREGCLALAVDDGDDGPAVHAVLRLPSDAGADVDWRQDTLWFHHQAYAVGSTLVFRATAAQATELSNVPDVCRETGLDAVVTAVPGVTDLALDPSARVIGVGDQLRVPVAELSNGGMDAAMRSDLTVVGGRCLGIEAPGTDTLLIWPFGTTVSYDPDPVVLLPSGKTYAVGDRLDLGGGYVHEPGTPDEPPAEPVAGLPEECAQLARFLVSPYQDPVLPDDREP
jgi:hypothetical protein